MTPINEFWLILGMVVVTFGVRYASLALVGNMTLPPPVLRALRFVPVAVLTAIIVPAMIMPKGDADFSLSNAYFYVGILAAIIAWRSKNLLLTIVVGMAIFLLWRNFLPF